MDFGELASMLEDLPLIYAESSATLWNDLSVLPRPLISLKSGFWVVYGQQTRKVLRGLKFYLGAL